MAYRLFLSLFQFKRVHCQGLLQSGDANSTDKVSYMSICNIDSILSVSEDQIIVPQKPKGYTRINENTPSLTQTLCNAFHSPLIKLTS